MVAWIQGLGSKVLIGWHYCFVVNAVLVCLDVERNRAQLANRKASKPESCRVAQSRAGHLQIAMPTPPSCCSGFVVSAPRCKNGFGMAAVLDAGSVHFAACFQLVLARWTAAILLVPSSCA